MEAVICVLYWRALPLGKKVNGHIMGLNPDNRAAKREALTFLSSLAPNEMIIDYANPGPISWPSLRRSTQTPSMKVVRGLLQWKTSSTIRRAVRPAHRGVCSHYGAIRSPYGPR